MFLFAIVHALCIGSGGFSTRVLQIFCVVILCVSCIINGIIFFVQFSSMLSVIVACHTCLVFLVLVTFCVCPMLLLLFMHCLCYYFCSHSTSHGCVVFLLLLLFMFHALVVVLLLPEFYTFFVLLVLHALLMVLLFLFKLCACLLLLLFMHHLCYYCCLHIISSGVVQVSCFTSGVACCCISHIVNVATLSMLFMFCVLLLVLLTLQPLGTFPWILSTTSLFQTLLNVVTTLHFLIVYGVVFLASYYVQVLKQ